MRLTETTRQMGRLRRWAALTASVLLGIAAASTAISVRFDVAAAATDKQHAANPSRVTVPSGTMVHQLLSKVTPKYPPEAKKARIQGKVELDAIVGKTGDVENLKVISGPSELQQSALDAVRQWKYKPFLVNGNPVEVETTINVIYSLSK